jgi:hypothetical protein
MVISFSCGDGQPTTSLVTTTTTETTAAAVEIVGDKCLYCLFVCLTMTMTRQQQQQPAIIVRISVSMVCFLFLFLFYDLTYFCLFHYRFTKLACMEGCGGDGE